MEPQHSPRQPSFWSCGCRSFQDWDTGGLYGGVAPSDAPSSSKDELLRSQADAADEAHRKDLQFLGDLLFKYRLLGICHFATTPITYVLTWLACGKTSWLSCGAGLLWLLGMFLKAAMAAILATKSRWSVAQWLEEQNEDGFSHSFRSLSGFCSGDMRAAACGIKIGCAPESAIFSMRSLPEYIDMDLDSATACNAVMTTASQVHRNWTHAWEIVPIVGKLVAPIGLPAMMNVTLIMSTLYQTHSLYNCSVAARLKLQDWPKRDDTSKDAWRKRFMFWSQLGTMCDVSSLTLSGEVCQYACIDICREWQAAEKEAGSDKQHVPPMRGAKFKAKTLYEAAPQVWFQVSFVALAYNVASTRTIITGCVSVITNFIFILQESVKNMHRILTLWSIIQEKTKDVLCLLFVLLLWSTSLIRFVGVYYCLSHVFNLTSGCVGLDKLRSRDFELAHQH